MRTPIRNLAFATLATLLYAPAALAQNTVVSNTGARKVPNPLGVESWQALGGVVIRVMTGISGSLALLMFVWGSVIIMTSQGDSKKIADGKGKMVWAAAGLALIFGAYAIVSTLFSIFPTLQ